MASAFRRWMQKFPHPHTLRGTTEQGDERDVRLGVGRAKWADAEKAIGDCPVVEALAEDGATLRVWGEETEKPTKAANRELVELAKIISDAHDKGAARCEGAYQLGFSHLVAVTNALSERLAVLEKLYEERLLALVDDANNGSDGGMDGVVGQIIASRFGVPQRAMRAKPTEKKPGNGSP